MVVISEKLKSRILSCLLELLHDCPHHPVDVAVLLEELTNQAWAEVFEFYPPSVTIE